MHFTTNLFVLVLSSRRDLRSTTAVYPMEKAVRLREVPCGKTFMIRVKYNSLVSIMTLQANVAKSDENSISNKRKTSLIHMPMLHGWRSGLPNEPESDWPASRKPGL